MHRRGMDCVEADFTETATLLDPTASSGTAIKVNDDSGNRQFVFINDPIEIGEPGALLYSGTISGGSGGDSQIITVTPALPVAVIPAGTHVRFPRSGAAIHLGNFQRIVYGASAAFSAGRTGDPTGAYPSFYGNRLGDIVTEGGFDSTDYWVARIVDRVGTTALPDIIRFRLRDNATAQLYSPGGFTVTGNFAANGDISVAAAGQRFVLGTNVWIVYDGANVKVTKNGGGAYTILV